MKLGKILLKRRIVSADDLDRVISEQGRNGDPLASSLLASGLADEQMLLDALSEQHNLPAASLSDIEISIDCLKRVPHDIARKNLILPIAETATSITLAMADPGDRRVIEELEFVTGKRIFPHVALRARLMDAIAYCYRQAEAGADPKAASGGVAPEAERAAEPAFSPKLSSVDPAAIQGKRRESVSAEPTGQGKSILVVDDEEDILRLISRVLTAKGYRVVTAGRGHEAVAKLRSEPLNLVILDAMLPEIHGFDICKQIKSNAKYKHLPVIMISAIYRGWGYAKDLKASFGVDDFLEKPFNIEGLVAVVEKHCEGESGKKRKSAEEASRNAAEALAACMDLYRSGDVDGAIRQLKEETRKHPAEFDLQYNLSLLLGKQERYHDAILALERALELSPDSFAALKNLAVLYQKTAFKRKAIETWERTLDYCPDEATRDGIKRHLVSLL